MKSALDYLRLLWADEDDRNSIQITLILAVFVVAKLSGWLA